MLYLQWVRQNLEQNPGELCKTGSIPLSLAVLGQAFMEGNTFESGSGQQGEMTSAELETVGNSTRCSELFQHLHNPISVRKLGMVCR